MSGTQVTHLVTFLPIAATAALWIGYDILVKFWLDEVEYPPVSIAIYRTFKEYPIVAVLTGLIVGILLTHFSDNSIAR